MIFSFSDFMYPRTPIKIARKYSGLDISKISKVNTFKENWNEFNGNGYLFIELILDNEAFLELLNDCEEKGYKKLPIKNLPTDFIYGYLSKTAKGFYLLKTNLNRMSYDLVVVEKDKNRIIVYVSVM